MSDPTAERDDDIRAEIRQLFTGDRTLGDSFVPPLLFVAVNAFAGLGVAAAVAVVAGAGVAAWRYSKGAKAMYAIGGIAAVGFAALLALRSGRAEGFFLPGIVSAGFWALAAVGSIAARRPLAGWSSSFFRGWPREWFWRDDVRPAYTRVTWLWAIYFALRFAGQAVLFVAEQPEALAAFKLATSWPTIIPLLIVSYRVGLSHRDRLGGPSVEEHLAGAQPPYEGQRTGF